MACVNCGASQVYGAGYYGTGTYGGLFPYCPVCRTDAQLVRTVPRQVVRSNTR